MADSNVDFDKIFASAAPIDRELEDHEYIKGWSFLGEKAPEFEDFDSVMRLQDKKAQTLKRAVTELEELEKETRKELEDLKGQLGGAQGFMIAANNLSDVADKDEARKNIGVVAGTSAGTFAAGDDSRFEGNGKLSGNNTWTGANLFNGAFTVRAPDGSPEGGEITLTDKDGSRAWFTDVDAGGNFRIVRAGNGANITTKLAASFSRATDDNNFWGDTKVRGAITATGELRAANGAVVIDGSGNITGSTWNNGNLKAYIESRIAANASPVKGVARGANAAITWGYISGDQYVDTHVPAGCYISGMQVKRDSSVGSANSGPIHMINALFYRPLMYNNGTQWLQIGDIA